MPTLLETTPRVVATGGPPEATPREGAKCL